MEIQWVYEERREVNEHTQKIYMSYKGRVLREAGQDNYFFAEETDTKTQVVKNKVITWWTAPQPPQGKNIYRIVKAGI